MDNNKQNTLGILGIGHLASYTIKGLRRSGDTRRIILNPRSAERAQKLAAEFDCEVVQSSQAVIDESDLIVLAVRPFQLDDLLSGLNFPADKVVVSAAAGVSLEQLREKAKLPQRLGLMLPLVASENAQGFVPIYPDLPEIRALTDCLGKTVAFAEESQYVDASALSCMNGWMYRFFEVQVNWIIKQGINKDDAREMVLHNTLGAAHYALGRSQQSLSELSGEIAKEGSYTKLGLDQLEAAEAFTKWSDALDMIKHKLDTSDD